MNIRAYIELSRLSNAPTVVSNVLVGIALGLAGANSPSQVPWFAAIVMSIAVLLLYISGMALNDVFDATVDRVHRPERPIPSERVTRRAACGLALACMAGGMAIAATRGLAPAAFAAALAASIIAYNALHRRFIVAVVFMGICRGLVYLTAAAAVAWPIEWEIAIPLALALTLYTTFVTIIARGESSAQSVAPLAVRLSILLVAIALAPALFVAPSDWLPAVIAALILIGWLVSSQRFLIDRPPRVKTAVMAMLAGICLVDAYYLAQLERPTLMVIAWACFVATMIGHQRLSGT